MHIRRFLVNYPHKHDEISREMYWKLVDLQMKAFGATTLDFQDGDVGYYIYDDAEDKPVSVVMIEVKSPRERIIFNVATAEGYRRQGHSRRLLRFAIATLLDREFDIFIEVAHDDNYAMLLKFYESLGFVVVDIVDNDETFFVMKYKK